MTAEDELLAKILAAPQAPAKKPRKPKEVKRDLDTWFFHLDQSYGKCEDPDCPDPRGKEMVMTAVVNEKRMCRFSFMAGFGV